MALRIGTSGFDYKHWRGPFYPPSLAAEDRLAFYTRRFDAVELNVTFYRMPAADAFRRWAAIADEADAQRGERAAEHAPADGAEPSSTAGPEADLREPFLFAVKASRYLTHVRRLLHPKAPVEYLMERAELLGRHLGPVLLQLPPDMRIELDRLAETLEAFGEARVAVEPRHESWFVPDLESLLSRRHAALCLSDRRGIKGAVWRTADWTYLRFHESGAKPPPCYSDPELRAWARRIREGWPRPQGVAFFNNDALACAVRDAARFRDLLAED
jgi:uncharacterized protein YecE (DUF72 family)